MYAYLDHAGPDPAAAAGLLGSITFSQLAGSARVRLTLWDTEGDAAAFARQHAELAALPGEIYQVVQTEAGPSAAQAPAYARLMYFDGPCAPEQVAAMDRAGRQRIWPAVCDLRGLVGINVLRGRDLGTVVITLATSVQTLDAIERTVMGTELMPGEDPALLPGPDRMEIHHVTLCHLPAAVAPAHSEGH